MWPSLMLRHHYAPPSPYTWSPQSLGPGKAGQGVSILVGNHVIGCGILLRRCLTGSRCPPFRPLPAAGPPFRAQGLHSSPPSHSELLLPSLSPCRPSPRHPPGQCPIFQGQAPMPPCQFAKAAVQSTTYQAASAAECVASFWRPGVRDQGEGKPGSC